jgi:putative MATE family efflux protein
LNPILSAYRSALFDAQQHGYWRREGRLMMSIGVSLGTQTNEQPTRDVDAKTRVLLEGPIVPTLLRLAWPNILVMLAQSSTGLIEMWYISRLGSDALAGIALVTPVLIFMQNISQGSVGGGISSTIARALGAGRRDRASGVMFHALIVTAILGAFSTIAGITLGRPLYRLFGGIGGSLDAAATYSAVVFAGMIPLWIFNALASALRGTGNMLVPGLVICGGTALLIPVSFCFIFGLGPLPSMGIAGGGLALIVYYVAGSGVLACYIGKGKSLVRFCRVALNWHPIKEILAVGVVGLVNTTTISIGITVTMALVARHAGPGAVAGFGTGSRLEYLLPALTFGVGAPLVALVGANIGADQQDRALRIAFVGAGLAALLTEAVGLAGAIWPEQWLRLFGSDAEMLAIGTLYLRTVGPFFGFFGIGISLYFASQGARRLAWPLFATIMRMCIAVGGGWLVLHLTGSLSLLLAVYAFGMVTYGLTIAAAVGLGRWGLPSRSNPLASSEVSIRSETSLLR